MNSNFKVAVDYNVHGSADFADIVVFDIYPHMMFDYQYGEIAKFRSRG